MHHVFKFAGAAGWYFILGVWSFSQKSKSFLTIAHLFEAPSFSQRTWERLGCSLDRSVAADCDFKGWVRNHPSTLNRLFSQSFEKGAQYFLVVRGWWLKPYKCFCVIPWMHVRWIYGGFFRWYAGQTLAPMLFGEPFTMENCGYRGLKQHLPFTMDGTCWTLGIYI